MTLTSDPPTADGMDPDSPSGDSHPAQRRHPALVAAVSTLVTLLLATGIIAVVARVTAGEPGPALPPGAWDDAGAIDTVPGTGEPRSEGPDAGENPDDRPSPVAEDDPPVSPEWLDRIAEDTRIPRRALEGYAAAQLRLLEEQPNCQVSWPTLAGIGWVESRHGTYAGGEIGPDGNTTVDVIGIPLDGGPGVTAIGDTDGGALDGDPTWDRAVGPMQFIPSTWERWGADATGDGTADPHNIDDAALSAARYLCADDRDLTTGDGWWEAIISYNRSEEYGNEVLATANRYAAGASG